MLIHQVIEHFQKYLEALNRSPETVRSYISQLNCWQRFLEQTYNGPIYLDELTVQDIENYVRQMKLNGQASSSRNRFIYIIKSLYNFCFKKKFIQENLGLELETITIPQKERSYLTEQEIEGVIAAFDHPLVQLVITTLSFTGLRINEALNLTIDDVDLNGKTIIARNTKSKRDRRIPIHDELLSKLLAYRDNWRRNVKSNRFFATPTTGKLSAVYVNRVLKHTLQRLGWTRTDISCHTFRHSFASNLIKKKQSVVLVQKLLGHSKLATTGIYTHADIEDLSVAVNTLRT